MQDTPARSSELQLSSVRAPESPTLPDATPSLAELFSFMAEAELRFETLRMRIVDRQVTTHGEEQVTHEIWLRHPGQVKVISTRGASSDRDYDVWVSDGETVKTYSAAGKTMTTRRARLGPVGAQDPTLPRHARVYGVQTALPAESLADTFVHPNGYCRNVLATGVISYRGSAALAGGRETILLRCDHPRVSHVLLDRPDHWLEVGVDAQTGMILLLAEHVADSISRHAEAIDVRLDEDIPDSAFALHVSADTRRIY
jgi:hypothetical protein